MFDVYTRRFRRGILFKLFSYFDHRKAIAAVRIQGRTALFREPSDCALDGTVPLNSFLVLNKRSRGGKGGGRVIGSFVQNCMDYWTRIAVDHYEALTIFEKCSEQRISLQNHANIKKVFPAKAR